jgi:hypothetical protein
MVQNDLPDIARRVRQNNPYAAPTAQQTEGLIRYVTYTSRDVMPDPRDEQWCTLADTPPDVTLVELFIGCVWWKADVHFMLWLLGVVKLPIYAIRRQPVKKPHRHQEKVSGAWRIHVDSTHVPTWLQHNRTITVWKERYPRSISDATGFKAPVQSVGAFVATNAGAAPPSYRPKCGLEVDVLNPITIAVSTNSNTPPYNTSLPHDTSVAGPPMTGSMHAGTVS